MKRSTLKIHHKIIFALLCYGLLVLGLAILSFQNHLETKRQLWLLQLTDEIVSNIFLMRSLEDDVVLSRRPSSIHQALSYANRIEELNHRYGKTVLEEGRHSPSMAFAERLYQYRAILSLVTSADPSGRSKDQLPRSETSESPLQDAGQQLLDTGQSLRGAHRDTVLRLLRQDLRLIIISTGFFLMSGIVVAWYISRLLVRPLVQIQEVMSKAAQGEFKPISEKRCKSEEFRLLLEAFNKMINELEKRHEELVQSRKIATIGTLTSGVAHELNNPITNISLSAESLIQDFHQLHRDEKLAILQDILLESERASEIVKNLLDFSRSVEPTFECVSISTIIQDTLKLVRNQMSLSHIRCETTLPPGLPLVHGERQSLQQLFLNLFINAVQAMPNGGCLKIIASLSDHQKCLNIEVSDTGVGIDPQHLPQIFDPFFTTKQWGQGTGLGLSVAYGILKKHGGRIDVESNKGKGTTFALSLPVRETNEISEPTTGVDVDGRV